VIATDAPGGGLVSVVIAGYNCASFIEPTLRSVLGQTCGRLEVVFVDDGSADATRDVVGRFAPAVRLLSVEHGGVSAARNAGIRATAGAYVAVLDHDDLWAPEKIERQLDLMEKHDDLGLVFTRARVAGDPSHAPIIPPPGGPWERLFAEGVAIGDPAETYVKLLQENFVPLSSILIRRSALPAEGFRSDLRFSEDHDLLLRISERHRFGFVDEALTTYTIRPGRATERMADMRLEDLRLFEENLARNGWLIRKDRKGMRRREAFLLREAGWWLLEEGRGSEARPFLLRAWRRRPLDPSLPVHLMASLRPGARRDPTGGGRRGESRRDR